MQSKTVRRLVQIVAVVVYLFTSAIALSANDYTAFILFNILLVAFIPLAWFTYRLKILSLMGFIGVAFLAHVIAPVFFFVNREEYAYKGWNAIWDFDFTINSYLRHYIWVYLFLVLIIILTAIGTNFFIKIKPWYRLTLNKKGKEARPKLTIWEFLIVFFLITHTLLSFWMFKNGVGMTGIKAPPLPYKLSGVLYYYTRFVVPLLMYFLLRRSSRNVFLLLLVTLYAFWAGVASLSKTGIALNMMPVLFYLMLDRKYIFSSIGIILFLVGINLVMVARDLLYVVNEGSVSLNDEVSADLFLTIIEKTKNEIDPLSIGNSVLQRIGGNQDVVVAYHYNTNHPGKGWELFKQYILLQKGGDNRQLIKDLIGVKVPKGFAYGLGFSARTLAISEFKFWRFLLLAFIASLQLVFNEILLVRAIKRIKQPEFVLFLILIFNLLFFVLVQSQRVYGYLFFLLVVLSILKIKEVKVFVNKLIAN